MPVPDGLAAAAAGVPLPTYGADAGHLAALTGVLVAAVTLLVQPAVAAVRPGRRRGGLAALLVLFAAAMLVVVFAADLLVLLVGWEVMGACSCLLIAFDRERPQARAAAVRAFLATKAGDVPLLVGVLLLGIGAGSFRIGAVLAAATGPGGLPHRGLAAVLLLGGVVGKSAQVPLHRWLPDAMAAPTPVSALLHAATMVAAGVYLVVRLFPLFAAVPAALAVLAVPAAVTAVGASLAALTQPLGRAGAATEDDGTPRVKRALAWSTAAQMGLAYLALCVGAVDAAVITLVAHAAAKALLFLAADASVRGPGRVTSTRTAWLAWATGLASLAGVPPLAGFLAKDGVLAATWHAATVQPAVAVPRWTAALACAAALAAAPLTAAYATRLLLHGPRPAAPAAAARRRTGAAAVALAAPLWLLAAACLVLSGAAVAGSSVTAWLAGAPWGAAAVAGTPSYAAPGWPAAVAGAALTAAGAGAAFAARRRPWHAARGGAARGVPGRRGGAWRAPWPVGLPGAAARAVGRLAAAVARGDAVLSGPAVVPGRAAAAGAGAVVPGAGAAAWRRRGPAAARMPVIGGVVAAAAVFVVAVLVVA